MFKYFKKYTNAYLSNIVLCSLVTILLLITHRVITLPYNVINLKPQQSIAVFAEENLNNGIFDNKYQNISKAQLISNQNAKSSATSTSKQVPIDKNESQLNNKIIGIALEVALLFFGLVVIFISIWLSTKSSTNY